MIVLDQPISVNYNNEILTITKIDPIIIDHHSRRLVLARLIPCPKPVPLWWGDDYDKIGDYTQQDIDLKISSLISNNPEAFIRSLF